MDLEGDEAFETLRTFGRARLVSDAFIRFRAADGFSHARALGFQITLTILPALIALIGLATTLDQESFTRVVRDTIGAVAPGAAGDLLTQTLRQGTTASQEQGENALFFGGLAALVAGATAMAQIERGANRIYGVERDRTPLRKYGIGLALAVTAGTLTVVAFVVLVGGSALRDAVGWDEQIGAVWAVVRWPLGIALAVVAIALLFQISPRRHQPDPSWLAFGSGISTLLWLVFTGALALYLDASGNFGDTYGPIAGTIGVLLWAFLTALALLLGLAAAAQLEAVRAGVETPREEG